MHFFLQMVIRPMMRVNVNLIETPRP